MLLITNVAPLVYVHVGIEQIHVHALYLRGAVHNIFPRLPFILMCPLHLFAVFSCWPREATYLVQPEYMGDVNSPLQINSCQLEWYRQRLKE